MQLKIGAWGFKANAGVNFAVLSIEMSFEHFMQ